jgi:hypothetical protein
MIPSDQRCERAALFMIVSSAFNAGRISGDNAEWFHILSNHASCANHCTLSNFNTPQYGSIGADRSTLADISFYERPVCFGLHAAIRIGASWKHIVDEHDSVANEYSIIDCNPIAYERMAGDFAVSSDIYSFLHFSKGADFSSVSNAATIEVDKIKYPYLLTYLYISDFLSGGVNVQCGFHLFVGYISLEIFGVF